MKNRRTVIGVCLVVCLSVGIAAAVTFVFFRNVIATPTAQETDTYGLNDKGVIAGDYVDAGGVQHGMLLAGVAAVVPKLTTADRADCVTAPGSTTIAFYAVNNLGVAAGWCTSTGGSQIGFTYSQGQFTDISIPGALFVDANGINDAGDVVGTYQDANGLQHGYLLSGGKLTTLDPPGTIASNTAWGINNAGVITIYGTDANGSYQSFTTADQGATYKPFHDPNEGPVGTVIHQISNNGDIVATVFDVNGNRHGSLYHDGQFTDYDDPNEANSTRGNGVNNSLVVVGRWGAGVYGGTGYQGVAKP